jgi:hypothetical protein
MNSDAAAAVDWDLLFPLAYDSWPELEAEMLQRGLYGGLYRVHALREPLLDPRNKPVFQEISRVVGTDLQGVLYIGCTSRFEDRFHKLRGSLSEGYAGVGHAFGERYKSSQLFQQNFPRERLAFTLNFGGECKKMEVDALTAYRDRHVENPPLNFMP